MCLTTVRRLRQEATKKEELAVQQPRRIAPPFPDVCPNTCGSREDRTGVTYVGGSGDSPDKPANDEREAEGRKKAAGP